MAIQQITSDDTFSSNEIEVTEKSVVTAVSFHYQLPLPQHYILLNITNFSIFNRCIVSFCMVPFVLSHSSFHSRFCSGFSKWIWKSVCTCHNRLSSMCLIQWSIVLYWMQSITLSICSSLYVQTVDTPNYVEGEGTIRSACPLCFFFAVTAANWSGIGEIRQQLQLCHWCEYHFVEVWGPPSALCWCLFWDHCHHMLLLLWYLWGECGVRVRVGWVWG